jgi:hypothetical protein
MKVWTKQNMASRKYTAALFEHVDFKAQAAEIARKAKETEQDKNEESQEGFFSKIFGPRPCLDWPRLILFGDSLTQYSFSEGGWGAMLAHKLQRRCDVINRGFSGYNSKWCRMILDKV